MSDEQEDQAPSAAPLADDDDEEAVGVGLDELADEGEEGD